MIVARGIGRGAHRGPIVSVGYGRRVVVPVIPPEPELPIYGGGRSRRRKKLETPLAITGVGFFVEGPAQLAARVRVVLKTVPPAPPTLAIPAFTSRPWVSIKPARVSFVGSGKIIAQQPPEIVAVGEVNSDEVDAILLLMSLDL